MKENSLMKRTQIRFTHGKTCSIPVIAVSIFILVLILAQVSSRISSSYPSTGQAGSSSLTSDSADQAVQLDALPELPRFAYFISGSKGDADSIKRLLQAVYHPRNYYLLHLDLEASDAERLKLAKFAKSELVLRSFRNVMVMGKPNLITSKGPTMIASTLHAVAILLKQAESWDWFINLSASDYPLMSQDDILHIFSFLPRDLNFLEHSSNLGWKEFQRARPIIIDPGLYHLKKSGVFWAKEKRSVPVAFKLFVGSGWVMLSRSFLEFCIWGWDNLPRTLLMYFTNFLAPPEGYFHTLVCNHKDYQNTTVNHDLRYIKWEDPPKQHSINLTVEHFGDMVQSGAPFAHQFAKDDPILNKIDRDILKRLNGQFTPGGWCVGSADSGKDPCTVFGDAGVVKPTLNSKRLETLVLKLLDSENFRSRQCM